MYQPYDVPRSFKNEAHHRLIHYRLATSSTYQVIVSKQSFRKHFFFGGPTRFYSDYLYCSKIIVEILVRTI